MPSGRGYVSGVVLFRGLRKALSQLSELTELVAAELGEALGHVVHGFVEPLALKLGSRFDHTTPHDMLEQFIPCFLERRRGSWGPATVLLFGHVEV